MNRIPLKQINDADKSGMVATLGNIFEHASWVAEQAAARRPFATLQSLHDAMTAAIKAAPSEQQLALIKGHPDLAGKAARSGALTAESTAEQASAGLDRLTSDEFETFHRLNDAYKAKFGIPFIVCVRRHTKDSILRQFELRLKNDKAAEQNAALAEIFRIGALRLDQLVESADKLKVSGRLSTHILDNHAGKPAPGIAIELCEISNAGAVTPILRTVSNADGRTDRPLISERPVPIGCYEIRFAIGDYFARAGVTQADPRFLDVVPIRFAVAEPEGHYHVPLLATPWSYSTYRGS